MPMSRRNAISDIRSTVLDLREEAEEDWIDEEYLREQLDKILDALDTVDRDGAAPQSTAAALIQEVEEAPDDLLRQAAEARLYELARRTDRVQAIPGVYPYPCDLLTYSDRSQCYVPDRAEFKELAAVSLAERYELGGSHLLLGAELPRVLDPDGVLTEEEAAEQRELEGFAYSEKTKINYLSQFRNWVQFAEPRGIRIMPAHPTQVVSWMTYRAEDLGHRPGTVRFGIEVLRTAHRDFGQLDPCDSLEVRRAMRGIRRRYGDHQEQVTGLTDEAIEVIEATARIPRLGRGGKLETEEFARARGDTNVAAVRASHDCLLRASEAVALHWKDLTKNPDGSGLIYVASSKTDQAGEGAHQYISPDTVKALERIRRDAGQDDRIFDFVPRTLSRRIKAECAAAGLEGRYTGHSGRVGMAMDLVADGAAEPEVMEAGRWRTRSMVRRYAQRQLAARSPVARLNRIDAGEERLLEDE